MLRFRTICGGAVVLINQKARTFLYLHNLLTTEISRHCLIGTFQNGSPKDWYISVTSNGTNHTDHPTAILSVYNKTGLLDLAKGLEKQNVRLLASGGTAKLIREAGIKVE